MKRYLIAITGASGAIIGIRLIEELVNRKLNIFAIISENGKKVLEHEHGKNFRLPKNVQYYNEHDDSAPVNSSSFLIDTMVIAPCSMKTLAAIAHGYSHNLIVRAADNQIRMNNKIIISPRETPLSDSHLNNMLTLRKSGAIICPPVAAYYNKPKTISDMTNFFVGKLLDIMSIPNELYKRWE